MRNIIICLLALLNGVFSATAKNTIPNNNSSTISLAFVGDVMMGTTFPDSVTNSHLPANDGKNLFDACRSILKNADASFLNVEGTFLDGPGKRKKMGNPKYYYVFRMPTKYVANLVDAGFDFAGVANNHINDFGLPGLNSTIRTLKGAGIQPSGLRGKAETAYLTLKNNKKIGFAQFAHSSGTLSIFDYEEVKRVVNELKKNADIVVVTFHGGAEGKDKTHVPKSMEMFAGDKRGDVYKFAHTAIDAGADVVVGHGPHVPRGMEIYNGRLIAYSLGNFCTPFRVNVQGVSGYAPLLEVKVDSEGKFVGGKIHSFLQQRGSGPKTDVNNSSAKLIQSLSRQDFPTSPLRIANDGTLSK